MGKLLKYEFKRSYKIVLAMCSVIILYNLVLFIRPISNSNILVYLLPIVMLSIFTVHVLYEIGIFKRDFIDNHPNIILSVPKPANVILWAKVIKSLLCFLLYYIIIVIFSLVNKGDYSDSIIISYNLYQSVPIIIIVFLNMLVLFLDMLLIGFLALLTAGKITYDKKKTFTLAFISGLLVFLFVFFLIISINMPFVYSDNTFQCSILAVIFVLLFGSICIFIENRAFSVSRFIKRFVIPVVFITLLSFSMQYIIYSMRVVETVNSTFVDNPSLTGIWKNLGKIDNINNFDPNSTKYIEEYFALPSINLMSGGETDYSYIKWTKNALINQKYSTENNCIIKEIYGDRYMFVEWKDKEYIYEHIKPFYLVLRQNKQ